MKRLHVVAADERHLPFLSTTAGEMFARSHAEAMHPDDIGAYLQEAFAPDRVRRHLTRPDNMFMVAEVGDEIAGYIRLVDGPVSALIVDESPIEVRRLYVLERWHGHGVGRALMEEGLERATSLEKSVCWLHVWERNLAAIHFYERCGFKQIGREGSAYRRSNPVALVMVRPVAPAR